MRRNFAILVGAVVSIAAAPDQDVKIADVLDVAALFSGDFTNEEQVYFNTEAKRSGPAWRALQISVMGDKIVISEPDSYGKAPARPQMALWRLDGKAVILDYGGCRHIYRQEGRNLVIDGVRGTCRSHASITRISPFQIEMTSSDGMVSELRRARSVNCWVAIRKTKLKPDGTEDWMFARGVTLHDQGGRALVGADMPDVEPVIIRVRNVTWDKGSTNKPVLALYIHKPNNPDRAEAYSWAAPDSVLVGINLRWVQSGCTIGPPAKPIKPK